MSSRWSSSSSSVETVIVALDRSSASRPTSNRSITQSPLYSRTSSRTRDRMPVSIRCPVISTVSLTGTSAPSRRWSRPGSTGGSTGGGGGPRRGAPPPRRGGGGGGGNHPPPPPPRGPPPREPGRPPKQETPPPPPPPPRPP